MSRLPVIHLSSKRTPLSADLRILIDSQTPCHPILSRSRHPALGTAALVCGTLLLCLTLADQTTGLPFAMPRAWYVNRSLWYFFAIGCFVIGVFLLRKSRPEPTSWKASRPGIRFTTVVLFTRESCTLCDRAKETLQKYAEYLPEIGEVDIAADPQLAEQYRTEIPVVEIDGQIRFRGCVSEPLLRRLLEATPPNSVMRNSPTIQNN